MPTINDPIHNTIVLSDEEERIVNSSAFQRLRRVKALGFLDRVFPSAKHSRFEHSIGACHVAGLIFDSIKKVSVNISSKSSHEMKWSDSSDFIGIDEKKVAEIFTDEFRANVRIAALLHDIGHGPFSHASEAIMCEMDTLICDNKTASDFIINGLNESKKKKEKKGKSGASLTADHEDYSLLALDHILNQLGFEKKRIQLIASLKSDLIETPAEYDKKIVRLLGQLIDGEIDSDRMDYLLRDSYFCGVPYGKYDLNRLCEGLCVVTDRKTGQLSFGILRKSMSAFEDFLFSRFQMHIQIYTHKIDASCNKSFEVLAKQAKYFLPASIGDYLKIDDENFLEESGSGSELVSIIRDRKLWPLALQSFSTDKSNEAALFEKFEHSLGKPNVAIYTSERPFKKATLLDFPVISRGLGGILMSDKMRSSSELIAHYNAVFNVKRLFYKPELREQAETILASIVNPIKFSRAEIDEKIDAANKVISTIPDVSSVKADDKK